MQNIKEYFFKYSKLTLLIIVSPFTMFAFNVIVKFLFNSGTYLGTFFRYLYQIVVC